MDNNVPVDANRLIEAQSQRIGQLMTENLMQSLAIEQLQAEVSSLKQAAPTD